MDSNQLVVGLAQALAWPLITFFIVLLLRKPFVELLKNIEKMKWQGVEFEFGRQLVNAEKGAKKLSLPSAKSVELPAFKQKSSLYEQMKAIAEISPAAAITDSWKAVEFAILEVAKAQNYDVAGHTPAYKIVEKLVGDQIVDQDTFLLYRDLRNLRNNAVHHSDFLISVDDALRYIDLSLSLANRLQEIANLKKSSKNKKK